MDATPLALDPSRPRPPGWYSDPAKRGRLRLWDGTTWTPHVVVRNRPERDSKADAASGAALTLAVMGGSLALSALLVVGAGRDAIEPMPADDLAVAVGVLAVIHFVVGLVMYPLVAFASGRRHPILRAMWSVICGGAGLATGLALGALASMNGQELC